MFIHSDYVQSQFPGLELRKAKALCIFDLVLRVTWVRDSQPHCEDPPDPAAVDNHRLVFISKIQVLIVYFRKLEERQDSLYASL